MPIRTKILLLLSGIVALYFCGLAVLKTWDRNHFGAVAAARVREQSAAFEAFFSRWSESLDSFLDSTAYSEPLAAAVEKGDRAEADRILSKPALVRARVDAAWLIKSDGAPFFTQHILPAGAVQNLPGPKGAFASILKQAEGNCHYYTEVPGGILDVRGKRLHTETDGPASLPSGYLFAARLLRPEDLRQMSQFTGDTFGIARSASIVPGMVTTWRGDSVFAYPLMGWDGRPMSHIVIHSSTALISAYEKSAQRLILWPVGFAFAVFLLLAVSLRYWVTRPLYLIRKSLLTENPSMLKGLDKQEGEMGMIAQLIQNFFEQKESLVSERRKRNNTEEALLATEDQLRQSQKMDAIGQLAGGIAHDFNNVLTAVMGYTELLKKHLGNDLEGLRQAEAIHRAADQAAVLTKQLLAFSRKQVLHPKIIDINAVLSALKPRLLRALGEHVELRVRTSAPEAHIRADRGQMEQLILNLAANANDAMPNGGILTLETTLAIFSEEMNIGEDVLAPGRYVAIIAADTGHGIESEIQSRIYEPFFTTKEAGRTNGLGLAMVYGIVKQSGGSISLSSAPDEGTTFTLHLPISSDETFVAVPATLESASTPPFSKAVLIVEDDAVVRGIVLDTLLENGYDACAAASAEDAKRLVATASKAFGLMIVNIVMAEMTGIALAATLRETNPTLKILYISGYAPSHSEAEISSEILEQVLDKPFTPNELIDRVRRVLS